MKIYKYASVEKAVLILKSGMLLVRNPSTFNDPFDTDLRSNSFDIAKTEKILAASSYLTQVASLINDSKIANTLKSSDSFKEVKKEYLETINRLKLTHRFDENTCFSKFEKWLALDAKNLKAKAIKESQKVVESIKQGVLETKNKILVTCFSKNPKSILMWAHYGDSHKGVCIEYERPDSADFVDIKYSSERPKLKTAHLTSFIAAKTILSEDYSQNMDQSLIDESMEPYQTKACDWEHEQEVRCMITTQSKSIVNNGENAYYKMSKPTKLIFGCKAKGEEVKELVKIAKKMKIKCVFLKKDKNAFLLK